MVCILVLGWVSMKKLSKSIMVYSDELSTVNCQLSIYNFATSPVHVIPANELNSIANSLASLTVCKSTLLFKAPFK